MVVSAGLLAPLARAQPYGLTERRPIGPYLDGRLPPTAPSAATGWTVVPAFPNLTFKDPTFLVPEPGTDRLCVGTLWGQVFRFVNNPATSTATVFLDLSSRTQVSDNGGLLGLAFHPQYGQPASPNRGYVYVFYQYSPTPTYGYQPSYLRLSRFTVPDGAAAADPGSELVLINQYDPHVWHQGGGLFFGTDGFLYLSVGDAGGTNDSFNVGQRLDFGLFSGVLRIDVDRNPSRSHPIRRPPQSHDPASPSFSGNYFIPNDNPFLDPAGGILEEFWAVGLRSPHRMTFDPVLQQIWVGDVGQHAAEEINVIVKGGNYQWPYREGLGAGPKPRPAVVPGIEQPPKYYYPPGDANNAVIGGYVYRGREHAATLDGLYIFGDNGSGRIWALHPGRDTPTYLCNLPPADAMSGLSSFGIDHQGELYLCKMGTAGRIYRLARAQTSDPEPPILLSQTGVFTNLSTLTPAPSLVPYGVNTELWSDYARKQRWIAVPNDGAPYAANETIAFAPKGAWSFPAGTVFVKHFELPVDDTNPAITRRLETRLLVRDAQGTVYGLTYKWRADGSDADLLSGSLNEEILIRTATGTRRQTWFYPSRQACLSCHTEAAQHVLGVSTRQLNGNLVYPSSGVTDNQLRTLNRIGLFSPALSETAIPGYDRLAEVTDTTAPLEHRVRSYLDANCAQCHHPTGARGFFDARFDTPLDQQRIIDGPLANSFGDPDMRVVAPGRLEQSLMYLRMNTSDASRMPPIARNEIDRRAVPVLAEWIASLRPTQPLPAGWRAQDVGPVLFAGSVSYAGGTFTVNGSGIDIWDTADEFHFAYQAVSGDAEIVARVTAVQDTDPWAKAGVMIRESLAPGARNTFMLLTPNNGVVFQRRENPDASTGLAGGSYPTAPVWVRLVRTGNTFLGYWSLDGSAWTLSGSATIAMPAGVYAGLAVTSHDADELCRATFDNVRIAALTAPVLPATPTGLTATAVSANQIDLTWTDQATNETGYRVERSSGGGFTAVALLPASASRYSDAGLPPATTFSYRVKATSAAGDSAYSNVATATTAAGAPPAWTGADLGAVGVPGAHELSGAGATVRGSGSDIWDTTDAFRFVYRSLTGDGFIAAQVTSLTDTHPWAKAGVMLRESLAPNAPNTFIFLSPTNGLALQNRPSAGATTSFTNGPWGIGLPYWVRLVRTGASVVASASPDGSTWTALATYPVSSGTVYIGLAVTSHDNAMLATGSFQSISATGATPPTPTPPATPTNLVATAASASRIDLTWTDQASNEEGFSIERSTDGTTFAVLATVGANVTTYANTGLPAATTYTYRVRATNSAGASAYSNLATASTPAAPTAPPPAAPTALTATAVSASQIDLAWTDASDNETGFEVERSNDGTTFVRMTTTAANTTRLADTGLSAATTFHYRVRAVNTAGASPYTAVASATTPATAPPPPPPPGGSWQSQDIGGVAATGSSTDSGGTVTVVGSGADIWDRADEFHFRSQPFTGDGEIIVRVASLTDTHSWAKAGLMFRETLLPDSRHAFMCVSAGNGAALQYRTTAAGDSGSATPFGSGPPRWLRLVRSGSTFTGYASADGITWTQAGTATLALPATIQVGLAVTSHNDGVRCTATFDNLTLRASSSTPPPAPLVAPSNLTATAVSSSRIDLAWTDNSGSETGFEVERASDGTTFARLVLTAANITAHADATVSPGVTYTYRVRAVAASSVSAYSNNASATPPSSTPPPPSPWSFADIGAVGRPGSNTSSGNTITVSGSGADIWDTADAFRFVYRSVTGDGSVEAQVTSLQDTHVWAKAGVMIRESLAPNARNAFAFLTPSYHGIAAQARTATSGTTASFPGPLRNAPYWVRLTRTGSQFVAAASPDGITWTPYATMTVEMGATVYFGFAVTSHDNAVLNTAVFTDPFVR